MSVIGPAERLKAISSGATGAAGEAPVLAADSTDPRTILSIQILRFLAAFGVAIFHAHMHLVDLQSGYRSNIVDRMFQIGAGGVHIFFVISGFVMVLTSFRGDRTLAPGEFFKRRILRIYPIYWAMAAAYVLAHQALGSPYSLSFLEYVAALLLLPSFASLIIGPGWTLTYEAYFYLAFGAALAFGQRFGMILLAVFFAGSVTAGAALHLQGPILSILSNMLLLEFLGGCGLGLLYKRRLEVPASLGYLMILGGVAGLVSSELFAGPRFPMTLALVPSSLLIVGGALILDPKIRGAAAKTLARLGDSSYFLYLAHILLIDLLLQIAPIAALNRTPTSAILLSGAFAIVVTVAAAIGHHTIELPLLRLLRRHVSSA